jgi:glycosyltransferase involved in cell wall biosynthesis
MAYFAAERKQGYRFADGHIGRALDFFSFERDGLLAAIDEFAPDVIHAHWTYEFAWAALDSGLPTVVTAHDAPAQVLRYMPDLYRLCRFMMARRVIARAPVLTAVSPDLAAELRPWVKGDRHIHVVANPLDKAVFQLGRLPMDPSQPGLMMVLNGWNGLKNGKSALRAFAASRMRAPHLRLICFGAGWAEGGPAQQWARANRIHEGVEFRGPRPHDDILACMRTSVALVHPSRNEACSMVIAEAMSVGLPVIAGRKTGGVAWQLDDGRAGWLVNIQDPAQISAAIDELISSPSRWSQVCSAAKSRAVSLFEVDRVVDEYEELYRRVLTSNHTRHPSSQTQTNLRDRCESGSALTDTGEGPQPFGVASCRGDRCGREREAA